MGRIPARSAKTDGSLLDLVIQTAPDAIVTIDETGMILSFSPAAERMFGYTEEELMGENVNVLMAEPHRSHHDGYIARYRETGEKRIIGIGRQTRARKKNGDSFIVELAIGELKKDGRHVFTGFIRDVTERKEAERRAARLQRMLDRVARTQALGEMSTALAHEINQPLSAISSFARAAQRNLSGQVPDTATAARQLDRIAVEAQRAGEILRRMRRLVDRGRGEVRPEDLNGIVRESVLLSRIGDEESGYNVQLELANDLPPVLADRIQIQQVIINLLRNAMEAVTDERAGDVHVATELSRPAETISIRARNAAADEVMVTIGDRGPGIPDDVLPKLFDPFTTTKHDGLGIGLAVCRTIVESHGGRIWAERNDEGGADFHFTLPAAASA